MQASPKAFDLRSAAPWLLLGAVLLTLVWLLAPILMPFAVGAALAYLGDPLVDKLQARKLSRTAAVCVVFAGLSLAGLLLLLLLVPLFVSQLGVLLEHIPEGLRWVQHELLPRLGIKLPAGVGLDAAGMKTLIAKHWSEAGGVAQALWQSASASGVALATLAANLLLVPVVSFYLLRDWDELVAWVSSMIPPRLLPTVTGYAGEADAVLGSFLRGQLSVMAALAVFYSIGLALCGLDLALAIGVLAGLVSFVPYLGFVVGFAAAALAMLVQAQELLPLLWVALVFGIGQVLESMLLTPTLVGDKIGLHPVAVIFAIMAGGQLFGFTGVLLALPAAAVLAVGLRHAKARWLASPLYGAPPPPPPAPPA